MNSLAPLRQLLTTLAYGSPKARKEVPDLDETYHDSWTRMQYKKSGRQGVNEAEKKKRKKTQHHGLIPNEPYAYKLTGYENIMLQHPNH